jgi:hypothetical protein
LSEVVVQHKHGRTRPDGHWENDGSKPPDLKQKWEVRKVQPTVYRPPIAHACCLRIAHIEL